MVDPDWQHSPAPAPPSPPNHWEQPRRTVEWSPPRRRTAPGGEELIDLAYDAAKARLESQTSAFESLRSRASGILSVAALVTSFAAGIGLTNAGSARGRMLPGWAAWTLLGILLALGCCTFVILLPIRQWRHGPSARIIMDAWQQGASSIDTKADVTAAMVDAQHWNSQELGKRSRAYRLAVFLLLVQILVLVAAVTSTG